MHSVTDPKEPDEILQNPASLGADGRLEQRMARVEPVGAPAEERIELQERAPKAIEARVEQYRDELRARSARPWAARLVIGTLLLGVIALGAFLHFKPKLELGSFDGVREASLFDQVTAGGEAPPIIISSTPTGATITIGGKTVGETPWAGENRWVGETPLTLKLPGYKAWEGKLKGGSPQTLDINLKK